MKFELELRIRPNASQSVCTAHEYLSQSLVDLPESWAVSNLPKAIEPKPGESEYFNLKKYTPKSLNGDLRYASRDTLRDHKSSDDYMVFEFSSDYPGVDVLDREFIESLILKLSPYYLNVGHSEFTFIDKEVRRKLNLRKDFCRFFPVTYFDDILCLNKFGIDSNRFFDKYSGRLEGVSIVNGGILYCSKQIITGIDESEAINSKVHNILAGE